MRIEKSEFEDLVNEYADTVYRCAYTYCSNRDDANDIVQEVFIKFLKKQPEFSDKEHEKAWFLRVTVNLCKDLLKSYWYKNRAELTDDIPVDPSDDGSEIWAYVQKLPPKYRIVIELYYYEGYTIKEIAEIVDAKQSTVGNRLARARTLLKDFFKEADR